MNHRKSKICISLLLYCLSTFLYASSTQNVFEITLSILSYVKWGTNSTPNLCVINNASIAGQFKSIIYQQKYNYRVIPLDLKELESTPCHAVFFSTFSPKEEQSILNHNAHYPVLSFSSNNAECDIGSVFCLYNKKNLTSFKVNLDSLSQSKVRVDPRVLLLAKPLEQ